MIKNNKVPEPGSCYKGSKSIFPSKKALYFNLLACIVILVIEVVGDVVARIIDEKKKIDRGFLSIPLSVVGFGGMRESFE